MSFQGDTLNNTLLLANEAELAARAALEPSAFAAIYDHYFPKVYNYVRYRVQDTDITDEITSQIFERMLISIGTYRPQKAPFGAWLFAIARNAVQDHYRSLSRRRWLPLDQIATHPSPEALPEDAVEDKDANTGLLQAVRQLTAREQDLIALKFASGMENKEIAKVVSLSESNVGVILFRALHQLRNRLGDKESSHE
jgi:RNA polymerase sigma-70 factor, ECF subfamily